MKKNAVTVPAEHFIITNRMVTQTSLGKHSMKTENGEYIVADGSDAAGENLRFGKISFTSTKKGKASITLYPEPGEEALKAVADGEESPLKEKFPSMRMFEELYGKTSSVEGNDKCEVLFFIHGYSCDLEDALETVQKLHVKYVENRDCPVKHVVLFTWPAMDKNLRYRDDALDAIKSGYALARGYYFLKEYYHLKFRKPRAIADDQFFPCDQYLHLMCHSMGNRVLESMFRALADERKTVNAMFTNIFLMAADIDYTALEKPNPMYNLIDFTDKVHVFYHRKDLALGISEKTKNALNRLGRFGSRDSSQLTDDVYQFDVTSINDEETFDGKVVHHWYHYGSDIVVNEVIRVMNGQFNDSHYLYSPLK